MRNWNVANMRELLDYHTNEDLDLLASVLAVVRMYCSCGCGDSRVVAIELKLRSPMGLGAVGCVKCLRHKNTLPSETSSCCDSCFHGIGNKSTKSFLYDAFPRCYWRKISDEREGLQYW